MIDNKYSKIRHLELLRLYLNLQKEGKNLEIENKNEGLELINYESKVYDFIFWKEREQFASLMENYVYDIIDFEDFETSWASLCNDKMDKSHRFSRDLNYVENFQHNPISYQFCSLVMAIFRQFEFLDDEECTEQDVKDYVRSSLSEIQIYL